MTKNEGTVTIPIDRYLELTKFLEDMITGNVVVVYNPGGHDYFTTLQHDEFLKFVRQENEDFQRHNKALQERIAVFNSKPWYQRVFKSKV